MAEYSKPLLQPASIEETAVVEDAMPPAFKSLSFLNMLEPISGSPEETYTCHLLGRREAGFEFNLFSPVPRLENGKNPYGLNGCMAAMIDHFYQLRYFKKDYTLEQIFKAYLMCSGNSIGKLKTFISEFRYDNSFIKHAGMLKKLKIRKLS